MYIYPNAGGPIAPDSTTGTSQPSVTPGSTGAPPASPTPPQTDRSDSVDISDAGRALAARGGQSGTTSSSLDPTRAAQIRERVLNGAYDTLEVVDAVARRVLSSGDL
jgi:negative regulator of flagellin synthesis FlgM